MEIKDPATFRALAHPLRLELFERLAIEGTATASELAELVDESPANCSFHLRVLAKHGYIERAEAGDGRQRPWRVVDITQQWGSDLDADQEVAKEALTEALDLWDAQRARLANRLPVAEDWKGVQFNSRSTLWVSADEARELTGAITDLIAAYVSRWESAERPEGGRPVRYLAQAYLVPDQGLDQGPDQGVDHA